MSATPVGTPAASSGTGVTSKAVAMPSGITSNELVFVAISISTANTITPADAGYWTQHENDLDGFGQAQYAVFSRVADGSEGSTRTFNFGAASNVAALAFRVSGQAASSPINVVSTTGTGTSGSTTAVTCPSVTTTADGCLILRFGQVVQATGLSDPGSHTAIGSATSGTSSTDPWVQACYQTQTSLGATGTAAFVETGGDRPWLAYTIAVAPSTGTTDQEGFRFGVDDANEASHTWSQAQDTNDTVALGTDRLIRALLNATGDPAAAAYTLRYQKNGSGGYVPVPVGSTAPAVYGSVTFGAIGTGANGSTTVAPSYPAGITSGQYLVCVVTSGATNSETPTTPSGWTLLATGASTDGTFGVDTGPRRVTAFGKKADGTESGTLTVSITNGNTCRGTISRFTKSGSGSWVVDAQGANDSGAHTAISMTFGSLNWNTGDAVLVATGQRVDNATQSSQSLSATGVTFGARTNRAATAVTTGNDHRHSVDTYAAVSGTSNVNAAPTWSYTASAAASAGGVVVRLREYTAAITNEVYVATSANIAAGGEATTARLTAPSGKTTSDFTTGRRWDDENGTDSINIAADFYTELEWNLTTQSPAANGDYYDFRVYAGSTALDSYTVTPRMTLGSLTAVAADTVTFSDSAVAIATRTAVASDTASFSDSAVASSSLVATASDTATFSDSATASASHTATAVAADTVSFSDSAEASSSLVAAASDSVTFSDSSVAVASVVAAASDTVAFSDSAAASAQLTAAASDSATFSDSAAASVVPAGRVVDAADTVSFNDAADAVATRTAAADDTVAFSDSAVAAASLVAAGSDSIAFSDAADAVSQRVATADDTASFSDSAVASVVSGAFFADASDTASFSDSAVAVASRTASAVDTIALSDSAVAQLTLVASATDTISLSDSAVAALGSQVFTVDASDTITFSDEAVAARPSGIASDPKLIARKKKPNPNIGFKPPKKKREETPAEAKKVAASPLLLGLMARGLAKPRPAAADLPDPLVQILALPTPEPVAQPSIAVEEQEVPPAPTPEQLLLARVDTLEQQMVQLRAELEALRKPPEPVQATPRDPVHEALHAILPALANPIDLEAEPPEPTPAHPDAGAIAAPVAEPPRLTRAQIDAENERRARLAAELLL